MNRRKFYFLLGFVSLILCFVLIPMHISTALYDNIGFSIFCLLFFIILSIIVYQIGENIANSKNKNDFTRLIIGVIAFKMFAAVAIVLIYDKLFLPTSNLFILPFFIIYFCYSIFEYYILIKLGKQEK